MARYRDRLRLKYLHSHHDLSMMSLGFALALIFSVVVFELLNLQFRWTAGGGPATGSVHPAASIREELNSAAPQTQETLSSQLMLTSENVGPLYVVPGQKDVYFLRFTLSPTADGFVHGMSFVLDKLARPYDLKTLKLFLGDKQLGEISFFEGKGSFKNLMLKLEANKLLKLSVVGSVSEQAAVGDRMILKLEEKSFDAIDDDGNKFEILGEETMRSKAMSVVQGRPSS